MFGKFIFHCDLDNIILAKKAVQALEKYPDSKDILISAGEGRDEVQMYARRAKRSISVKQVKP